MRSGICGLHAIHIQPLYDLLTSPSLRKQAVGGGGIAGHRRLSLCLSGKLTVKSIPHPHPRLHAAYTACTWHVRVG